MTHWIGWLLGIDNVTSIDEIGLSLAAPWAESPFWVFLGAVALVALALVFYLRYQAKGPVGPRVSLGICRGLLLALLLFTLADPVLQLTVTNKQLPFLYLVFDGTDSMAIEDQLPEAQRAAIESAVGWKQQIPPAMTPTSLSGGKGDGNDGGDATTEPAGPPRVGPSRMDYLQALLRKPNDNPLVRLLRERDVQIEAFVFDGNTTSQIRKLAGNPAGSGPLDPAHLADQLSTKGQVTALGSVVHEVGQQFGQGRLAGVVMFSDFAHNSGVPPLGKGEQSPVNQLGVPIYSVGVGATEAVDLAVDLQTDPKMKKAERSSVVVKLRQSGLAGESVTVNVVGRRLSGESPGEGPALINIGQKTVTLDGETTTVSLPFTPEESGRFEFTATTERLDGEVVDQNNRAARQVNIIDDYLRLMYVAHEPTWEWRFIKEVFHRDKLVGMQGFRTFLASSDPRVRESNILFLPTLTPKRSDFFANDVLFLDDMPKAGLSDRFCEMVKEYVGSLGGGLVVIAGPRFGPRELHQTPLADMLPVLVDPTADIRSAPQFPEFRARLTPYAAGEQFMRIGASELENAKAWDNLGKLPWYQPVANKHPDARVLAEHPTDKCRDGKTPQPLIATRPYGKGEVVYLGFNEMWRLRRKYGEKYYRQFWSQLIYRLGMSHALGADKRFVARLDQQQYRTEDKVLLTVEAYDENYEPLADENLPERGLLAELTIPGKSGSQSTTINVPMLRKGVFEARIPVFAVGEYSLRVKDPVTGKFDEQRFEVSPLSAERRQGVRNEKLQNDLAQSTSGRSYDLTTVSRLADDLKLEPVIEKQTRNRTLWNTPLWFAAIVALMLGEWLARKMIRLS
ncbi:MAG: hypothetical protein SFU86_13265 [Pirellulaceae bacterium]|nr:hypothetical protein [Pirellulaceae bacterium]